MYPSILNSKITDLLDTNIVQEMMRTLPNPNVVDWLNQNEGTHYLSAITIAEISFGLRSLRKSKKRTRLEKGFSRLLAEGFFNRIVPFDNEAALQYGKLMALRRKKGKPMSTFDGQIAAIAQVRNCVLVTRNIRDFKHCELELIDPFSN